MDKFLNANTGSLHLIIGPMFAGKSSELMKQIRRLQYAKKKCLVISYKGDTRYSCESVMSTHDKLHMKAVKCETIKEAEKEANDCDVIGIDEGQFFQDVDKMAIQFADQGKIVIVAALDGTFQREPFGNIHMLMPNCESITKLTAICIHCGNNAAFTRRKIQSQAIQLIGSSEIYEPVCRACFIQQNHVETKHIEEVEKNEILKKQQSEGSNQELDHHDNQSDNNSMSSESNNSNNHNNDISSDLNNKLNLKSQESDSKNIIV